MNTKISTIFKTSILAVAVLMIAFMFSACGGNGQFKEVKVDTDADYQASNLATVSQLFADAEVEEPAEGQELVIGFHASVNMETTGINPLTNEPSNSESTYNLFYKKTFNEQGNKIEIALKASGNENGVKSKMTLYFIVNNPVEGEGSKECYADINTKQYGITTKGKFKINLEAEDFLSMSLGMMCEAMASEADDYLPEQEHQLLDDSNNFAVATKDNITKVKIVVPGETEADTATIYYVFKDGKFNGAKIENIVEDEMGTTSVTNMTIESWNGDIEYPNFDKFEDLTIPSIS